MTLYLKGCQNHEKSNLWHLNLIDKYQFTNSDLSYFYHRIPYWKALSIVNISQEVKGYVALSVRIWYIKGLCWSFTAFFRYGSQINWSQETRYGLLLLKNNLEGEQKKSRQMFYVIVQKWLILESNVKLEVKTIGLEL